MPKPLSSPLLLEQADALLLAVAIRAAADQALRASAQGAALEAKKGSGVGFFSDSGELLCVIFDEIQGSQDQQTLEFNRYRVELVVKNGKVTHSVTENKLKSSTRKKRVKRKQPV